MLETHDVVTNGIPHGHTHTICGPTCECWPECKKKALSDRKKIHDENTLRRLNSTKRV